MPTACCNTSSMSPSHYDTTSPAPLGLLVHPTRNVDQPRQDVLRLGPGTTDVEVVPLRLDAGDTDQGGDPGRCSLIVAIGGDGTALAAIRRAATCGRPVLGVACGSLGALTSVPADEVARALDRFQAGEWSRAGAPGPADRDRRRRVSPGVQRHRARARGRQPVAGGRAPQRCPVYAGGRRWVHREHGRRLERLHDRRRRAAARSHGSRPSC